MRANGKLYVCPKGNCKHILRGLLIAPEDGRKRIKTLEGWEACPVHGPMTVPVRYAKVKRKNTKPKKPKKNLKLSRAIKAGIRRKKEAAQAGKGAW